MTLFDLTKTAGRKNKWMFANAEEICWTTPHLTAMKAIWWSDSDEPFQQSGHPSVIETEDEDDRLDGAPRDWGKKIIIVEV